MKKLLILILSALMILTALTACKGECTEHVDEDKDGKCDECGEAVEIVCTEHVDEDGDKSCDICDELLYQPPVTVEVDVTFTLKDQDAAVISGVEVTLTPKKGGTPIVATSDAAGKLTVKLAVGGYSVSYDYDSEAIGYYLATTTSVTVGEATTALDLLMQNNNPNGTAERPYVLSAGSGSITMAGGVSSYYAVYRAVDLLLDLESDAIKVTYKGDTYLPEAGVVNLELQGEDTNSVELIKIENTSSAEITVSLELYSRLGTLGNPHVITDLSAPITAENVAENDIIYYTYTATADGTLTLTLETENAYASMMNTSNSVATSTTDAGSGTITITLSEGDKVIIDCAIKSSSAGSGAGSAGSGTGSDATATITFTLSFTPAE